MRPRPENYKTRAEYKWAMRQWRKRHGGSMAGSILLALFFGAATGSQALLLLLLVFAVLAHLAARSETRVRDVGAPLLARRARRAGMQWRCQKNHHAVARTRVVCPIDNSPCGYYPKETKR